MTIAKLSPFAFGNTYSIGWLGFTRTFDTVGDLIAYGERLEDEGGWPTVNHAFIVTGEGCCVQAHIDTGVQYGRMADYFDDSNTLVYFRKPLLWTPELGSRIAAAGVSKIGAKYDTDLILEMAAADSLVGVVVNDIFHNLPHYELAARVARPDEFICSQLGAYALAAQPEYKGCPLLQEPLAAIDPQSLFQSGPFEDFINQATG